ncbi:MAG TPA: J domain-containing protein [Candidatus Dormibacteraeota bacterium]|jgi:hypothetical protein|nr:J domain-containing protein [Candidatus Dormibacteraeota bacterium]
MADYTEDYYRILGVTPNAEGEQIRDAWRRLISYWHPDRTNHPAAEERAKELNRAYQVLSNPASRADYDNWYRAQQTIPTPGVGNGAAEHRSAYEAWEATAATVREQEGSMPRGWRPPPPGYNHVPDVDPLTGMPQASHGSHLAISYCLWLGGFLAWLAVLAASFRVAAALAADGGMILALVIDVLGLWIWLFAIAAIVRLARHRRRGRGAVGGGWTRFWVAELLGALGATSVTLLITSVGILMVAAATRGGIHLFQNRGWVGVALPVLAISGALGAAIFRAVWQRWEQVRIRDPFSSIVR